MSEPYNQSSNAQGWPSWLPGENPTCTHCGRDKRESWHDVHCDRYSAESVTRRVNALEHQYRNPQNPWSDR